MKKTNLSQVEMKRRDDGEYGFLRGSLTQGTAAQQLTCSVYELAPGKKSFPFHFHYASEEAILVLEGEGSLRLGEEKLVVSKGDYIPLPIGRAHAHQMINESSASLRYIAFSTFAPLEIAEYPDSNKVGIFAGMTPGKSIREAELCQFHDKGANKGYYEGEK